MTQLNRPTLTIAPLVLALLGVAASAEAVPFDLFVASEMTFSGPGSTTPCVPDCSYLTGVSGSVVALDLPIDFQPIDGAIAIRGQVTSDTPGVGGFAVLIAFETGVGLQSHQRSPAGDSDSLFTALLDPSQSIFVVNNAGLVYAQTLYWEAGFTGTARLNYTFAIDQDVARYSVDVTRVAGDQYTTAITAAQRVSSVFDPDYSPPPPPPPPQVPEPSTALLMALGAIGVLRSRFRS